MDLGHIVSRSRTAIFLALLFLRENNELKGKEEKRWVINIKCFSFYHKWDWSASSIIDFSWLIFRLRDADVTPSHITSLDVTPSDVRTLDVLTSGHYTFGKLHLRAVSPLEYYTFRSYTFRCFTFGTLHLQDLTTLQNYNFHSFWRHSKVKSPKL